jgi:hypothetical protein
MDMPVKMTRTGQTIRAPSRLIQEIGAVAAEGAMAVANYEIALTNAELNYYQVMMELGEHPGELACVGVGLGGGFDNTNELHVMKYGKAMATDDRKGWEKSTDEEHDRMVKREVWEAVPPAKAPKGAKVITSAWAMKKKSNGTLRARVNARVMSKFLEYTTTRSLLRHQ